MNSTLTNPEVKPVTCTPEGSYLSPRVNLTETSNAFVLEAEMPGVTRENLEILLENRELTLAGRRPDHKAETNLVYRESSPRDYRRVFVLDETIDVGKVEAKLKDGLLTLRLAKVEQAQPRRIAVTA
ncbi:MAG: Hsp20/alpha crystallin family protein [Pedosphaera sp.]|nr:Hsp20/alpha crystallin family protein [Pedosphaera sp.]